MSLKTYIRKLDVFRYKNNFHQWGEQMTLKKITPEQRALVRLERMKIEFEKLYQEFKDSLAEKQKKTNKIEMIVYSSVKGKRVKVKSKR